MKIKDIYESTTSGSVASVAMPLGKTQKRGNNLLSGKKTSKKYTNSVNESKMKELAMDLKDLDNGNFQKKYKKSKSQMKAELGDPESKKTVHEAHLEEEDLILVPGQGHKLKSGFIPHGESRLDHEVEMARSDLFSAAKNAKQVYELIADLTEDEGLEGWVQEKIIKANDYLNTIREYLEGKQLQSEMTGGVIAGGGVGESKKDMIDLTPHLDNLEKAMNSMIAQGDREDKYPSYRRKMIDKRYELEKAGFPKGGIKKAPGLTKTVKPSGAGNFEEAVDPIAKRITVKKWGGDDKYSWAVLVDGRPAVTGLGKSEVPYYKNMIMKKLQAKPHLTGTNLEEEGKGLWANIHAKRERIKKGSGERMRKPGSKGAPSAQDFKDAAK